MTPHEPCSRWHFCTPGSCGKPRDLPAPIKVAAASRQGFISHFVTFLAGFHIGLSQQVLCKLHTCGFKRSDFLCQGLWLFLPRKYVFYLYPQQYWP
jgi:hypothetical protein